MIAALSVYHPFTKSSPPNLSCMLSELIMSSEEKGKKQHSCTMFPFIT